MLTFLPDNNSRVQRRKAWVLLLIISSRFASQMYSASRNSGVNLLDWKTRINPNLEHRIREEMRHEGISDEEARRILVKDDAKSCKWSMRLYGINTWDPMPYDIVIYIDDLGV